MPFINVDRPDRRIELRLAPMRGLPRTCLTAVRARMFVALRRRTFPARAPAFTIFSLSLSAAALTLTSPPVEFWHC